MEKLEFRRVDGRPFRILARGDCTSRRFVRMNPEFFPDGVEFVQSEKSPFILFLDAIAGKTSTPEILRDISDVDQMPKTLQSFYLGQADRSILSETGADLLILDSYADQNFELYEHIEDQFKVWIHPKFLRDHAAFEASFRKIGRRSLSQSVADGLELITRIREKNPNIPVLVLNQQVEFYPKLHNRLEYYDLGKQMMAQGENIRAGRVMARDELALADVGSCGPGNTLHWQKETYAAMVLGAYEDTGAAQASTEFAPKQHETGPLPADTTVINYQHGSPCCTAACDAFVERSVAGLAQYTYSPTSSATPRFTPMIIPMDHILDFLKWESQKGGFVSEVRLREKKRALKQGFHTKRFSAKQYVPDMYDIDTSMENRSGGKMRGNYIRSVEERGGAPDQPYPPVDPKCPLHWSLTFGVFEEAPGHRQGSVETGEKLIAYLSLRRTGELALYAQIMGHGDYLRHGVMSLLHHDVIEWIGQKDNPLTKGVTFIMYGGEQNGGDGLKEWKRRSGFNPQHLFIKKS